MIYARFGFTSLSDDQRAFPLLKTRGAAPCLPKCLAPPAHVSLLTYQIRAHQAEAASASADRAAQEAFIRQYERLIRSDPSCGTIVLPDAVHPEWQSRPAHGWFHPNTGMRSADATRGKEVAPSGRRFALE